MILAYTLLATFTAGWVSGADWEKYATSRFERLLVPILAGLFWPAFWGCRYFFGD